MQQSVTMHQQRQEQKDYKLTNMEENDAMQRNCKKKKNICGRKNIAHY